MILVGLVNFIFDFVANVLGLLPAIKLPSSFIILLDDIEYIFSAASYFLPINSILTCLTVIFLVDNFKFFVSVFNFCISKIPMIK